MRPQMEIGPLVVAAYHEWHDARAAYLITPSDAADYETVARRYRLAELTLATHCALGIGVALAAAEDAAADPCSHSACSQHYIDTGSRECVEKESK